MASDAVAQRSNLDGASPTMLPTPVYVGGGAQLATNFHSLNIPVYKGSTLCGVFERGNGLGLNALMLYEKAWESANPSGLWIAPRLNFNSMGAKIVTPSVESGARARDPRDSSLIPISSEHRLDASLFTLGLELLLKYPLTSALNVMIGPGVDFLIKKDATQTEIITSPSQAHFNNGTNTVTYSTGKIPNAASFLGRLSGGVSYDIPLSTSAIMAPELLATYHFPSIRSDVTWNVISLSVGASLKFNVASKPTPPQPAIVEKPVVRSEIAASVKVVGVVGGEETSVPTLRVEEFVTREAYPLLNYIFFEAGKNGIPARYNELTSEQAAAFDPDALSGSSELAVYYQTLNIVGKRLRDNTRTSITLQAANDRPDDPSATKLALARAEAIKDYVTNVWNIDPRRVTATTAAVPPPATSGEIRELEEENQRVEILANDPSVLEPLTLEHIDRSMNPPTLRVKMTERSNGWIRSRSVRLKQNGTTLVDFGATNQENRIVDWTPSQVQMPHLDAPLVAEFNVQDDLGGNKTVYDTSRVEQLTIKKKREEKLRDRIVERYNLITFDFDKANLDDRSRRIVKQIAQNVTPKDSIEIVGYTDLLGEAAHNQSLSNERARNVQEELRRQMPEAARMSAVVFSRGVGEKELLDNKLPEGRFLSRTVRIRVLRPIGM